MDSLVRNATVRYGQHRLSGSGYEALNPRSDEQSKRGSSRPRQENPVMMTSFSYRRRRATQRQIFLTTYKLESQDSTTTAPPKSKKLVVRVKTVVIAILSFMRADALKPCSSGSAVCAASPSRVAKIC